MEEKLVNTASWKIRDAYQKDILDVFSQYNQGYQEEILERGGKPPKPYKDDIFSENNRKTVTYYIVWKTQALASNRLGFKSWCLSLAARWPWASC